MKQGHHAGPVVPVVAVLVFAAVAGTFRLRSYDLFWHLATGRWILDHGRLPTVDPFRFTSANAAWIDHGWLFQVLLRQLELVAGLGGLAVARSLVVAVVGALLLTVLRRSQTPWTPAVLITAAAILGARPRFMMRPELASLVCVPLLIGLLQSFRRSGSWRVIAGMSVLVVVWSNLHAGVVVAPLLAGTFLLGSRIPAGGKDEARGTAPAWRTVLLVPFLLVLGVMANPSGAGLLLVPLKIRQGLAGLGAANPEWLPVWELPSPGLLVGFALALLVSALGAVRGRRFDGASILTTLLLVALACASVRHQGIFFLGSACVVGQAAAALAPAAPVRRPFRTGSIAILVVCGLGALWCVSPPGAGPLRPRLGPFSFGTGLEPDRFPTHAAREVEQRPDVGPLYNDVAFGGYLIWRLYPPRKVFIDGRNEVNPSLLAEIDRAGSDELAWDALLDRYGVDGALVRYRGELWKQIVPGGGEGAVTYHTQSWLQFPKRRFALVYWDDTAMLFLRRTDARSALLAREEYRFVHPEDVQATLTAAASDTRVLQGALRELDRRLTEDPRCRRALDLQEALKSLQRQNGDVSQTAVSGTGM